MIQAPIQSPIQSPMNKIHKHIFSLAAALVLLAVGTGFFLSQRGSGSFVFAADNNDVEVDFESAPLFNQDNMLPGDTLVGRWFTVTNNSTDTDYPLHLVINKTGGDDRTPVDFANVLSIEIKKDGGDIVYDDTLKKLFDKVDDNDGIDENDGFSLETTLAPGDSQKFFISVEFTESAGNEYQDKEVIWEAILGFVGTVVVADDEDVLSAVIGPPGSILGIATGADLIYSVLGSLAALSTGLYLRRRSSKEDYS